VEQIKMEQCIGISMTTNTTVIQ